MSDSWYGAIERDRAYARREDRIERAKERIKMSDTLTCADVSRGSFQLHSDEHACGPRLKTIKRIPGERLISFRDRANAAAARLMTSVEAPVRFEARMPCLN